MNRPHAVAGAILLALAVLTAACGRADASASFEAWRWRVESKLDTIEKAPPREAIVIVSEELESMDASDPPQCYLLPATAYIQVLRHWAVALENGKRWHGVSPQSRARHFLALLREYEPRC